jgi:hypothetical protein
MFNDPFVLFYGLDGLSKRNAYVAVFEIGFRKNSPLHVLQLQIKVSMNKPVCL